MTALPMYRRLLHFARPYWAHLAGLFALSLAATPIALLTPLPIKIVVDSVVGSRPLPSFLGRMLTAASSTPPTWKIVLLAAIAMLLLLTLLAQLQRMTTGML